MRTGADNRRAGGTANGERVVAAKMGMLAASILTGMIGYAWLRWVAPMKVA